MAVRVKDLLCESVLVSIFFHNITCKTNNVARYTVLQHSKQCTFNTAQPHHVALAVISVYSSITNATAHCTCRNPCTSLLQHYITFLQRVSVHYKGILTSHWVYNRQCTHFASIVTPREHTAQIQCSPAVHTPCSLQCISGMLGHTSTLHRLCLSSAF